MAKTHVTNRSWTPEMDERLKQLVQSGASVTRAAAALKRTVGAVQTRARNLGMPFKPRRIVRGTWIGPGEYKMQG
jgi:hypothetical protein